MQKCPKIEPERPVSKGGTPNSFTTCLLEEWGYLPSSLLPGEGVGVSIWGMSEPEEAPVEAAKEATKGRFQPGQSGNRAGFNGIKPKTEEVPPLLAAMRYVATARKGKMDGTTGLKAHCRRLLEEQPGAFLKQMHQLETDYLRSKEPSAKNRNSDGAPVEAADQDLNELITSLIGGFHGDS